MVDLTPLGGATVDSRTAGIGALFMVQSIVCVAIDLFSGAKDDGNHDVLDGCPKRLLWQTALRRQRTIQLPLPQLPWPCHAASWPSVLS